VAINHAQSNQIENYKSHYMLIVHEKQVKARFHLRRDYKGETVLGRAGKHTVQSPTAAVNSISLNPTSYFVR